MEKIRAEILDLQDPLTTAARITINAPANKIFELIADPYAHAYFDGSGTVERALKAPERLSLGAKFGMGMRIKVPYRIKNTVTAFEEGSLISWCHFGGWTWSDELNTGAPNQPVVPEFFEANSANAFGKWWIKRTDSLNRNPKWMAKSLVLLKALAEQ